ncbi:MAG: long-chain fatty acid--CoA ligase [Micavibrio aeruginosavorus]|uniref:Long-chain fatty acid--CoA ligase n=1 Tax=Micavibrio aeruginosavorus TaxID=349221 RepID=A0A7T5UH50_9BACT|nr:MAG: long-chain fatty acid--CoA ligase [Micavibrio aeruginosavorus]
MNTASPLSPESSWPWLAHYPQGIDWHAPLEISSVCTLLERTAAAFPQQPAVDFMGHVQTWGEVGRQVNRLAKGLQGLGVKKGTRVGLFLPNCSYFPIAYYAILKAGGTVVNFNPLYAPRELVHQIRDSQTEIMLTLDLKILYDKLAEIRQESGLGRILICPFADILPFPKSILFPLLKRRDVARIPDEPYISWLADVTENDGLPALVAINPDDDVAVLQYTGGTTGVPKGAMLTHANIVANTHQCALWFLGAKPGEKMLGVIPFFHVFAMTAVMNLSVYFGFEIIIPVPRFDLDKTLRAIHKKKPHYFPAVPAIYNAINNHSRLSRYNLRSLRFCMSGGAPLPVEVKKVFEQNTGCVVVEGYGLTETTPVVCVNPVIGENRAGSIGLPLPQTVVEVVSPEDKVTVMKTGERGELCVRGPQVMKGYWNKPGETANVLRNGRLHTGDIALMDEDGYVYIVDRIKDMILVNGYNVYPRNVEEAIYLNPAIEECIVAGLPDPERGETVKAWIKLKAGQALSEADLLAFLKDKISPIEMPRQIEFREKSLPKTMIGKLSRKDIVAEEMAKR